jgi:hypothetical protein
MKDNRHITQNQTIKININTGGKNQVKEEVSPDRN